MTEDPAEATGTDSGAKESGNTRSSPRHAGATSAGSLRAILEAVQVGDASLDEAIAKLATWPTEDLGFARLDHHRAVRTGFPEVVFGPGKRPEDVATALERLADVHGVALATRLDERQAAAVKTRIPDAVWHEVARAVTVDRRPLPNPGNGSRPVARSGGVAIVAAGTADLAVAEEAAVTAQILGSEVTRVYDVGVAGLHRLLAHVDDLAGRSAIVAVAGMEGALPGVVAGLVTPPVIAVPTSVGYGAHLGGVAALLTMLNACAPGIAVVNIDNGFGAGYMAALIDGAVTNARYPVGAAEPANAR